MSEDRKPFVEGLLQMTGRTQQEQEAYELGAEHARNAASWIIDGNVQRGSIVKLVEMLDAGDPQAFDYLPREPNLSGEFADDPTPASLWEEITGQQVDTFADLQSDATGEAMRQLCDAYDAGVSDTFQSECERILRAAL